MIHRFKNSIKDISLPEKFTYPFNYTPHPLCVIAADEVKEYLNSLSTYPHEISDGKMFGVLVIEDNDGKIGYISAFSGIINSKDISKYFVPPVYDLQSPSSFFSKEEKKISLINNQIDSLQANNEYKSNKELLNRLRAENSALIESEKNKLKLMKEQRDRRRKECEISPKEEEELIRESQFQKAEFKRLQKEINNKEAVVIEEIDKFGHQIAQLKEKRKRDSEELQKRLFSEFKFLNALGQEKDLWTIFSRTPSKTPPAGAGECAAPRLLQYAYINKLKPIAMAEFWIGNSPQKEIRHEGLFYPACIGKCKPILTHMLIGLNVDENPDKTTPGSKDVEILYEDDYMLAVNKPSGILSVPGKEDIESIESIIRKIRPEISGPTIVHRLDMATSGIMIIAKSKEIHKKLQSEFINREIKKRYIAILDGDVKSDQGFIRLPLSPDYYDRPRQKVDYEDGKIAVTRYKVINRTTNSEGSFTKIELYPLTGRTHQLRVHCAHKDGLNTPILGDTLYGKSSKRLYLHAERIEFRHPVTNKVIAIEKKEDF